jgi:large subunit ribosomal protein L18
MRRFKNKQQRAVFRRKYHVRKKVFGTPERPRLMIFRSNRNVYAQIIDDVAGATLASAGTTAKPLKDKVSHGGNVKAAEIVGEQIAKEALGVGIKCVCFDRNRYKYHGRTRALAEAARKAGLVF